MEVVQALLESNQPDVVENLKKKINEQFSSTKESWLLSGLFDCYLQTSSMRLVEILGSVREPHDRYLFDKLYDTLRGQWKLQGLTLLGHVVRRHPTWLIKITQHPLLKELLRLLKAETDILLLMSALLVIIILLPMIPSLMGPFLPEIFEVFGRLAAWNTNNPNKVPEENLLHLQVGLCELFHRLYGMYPCNFLSYLRQQYGVREHLGVFSHTIKPMVCSVRMHPLLVTASKDAEIAINRWKRMEDHDIIVECAKYALDNMTRDEICPALTASHRSKSAMECSHETSKNWTSPELASTGGKPERAGAERGGDLDTFWSPTVHCGLATPPPASEYTPPSAIPHTPGAPGHASHLSNQEGTSPPEAAIEATPETTPVKDSRTRLAPISSAAVRALNSSLSPSCPATKWTTSPAPSAASAASGASGFSQPSSPMRKEQSLFRYPAVGMTVNIQGSQGSHLAATPPPPPQVLSSLATPPPPVEGFSAVSAFQQPRRDSLLSGGTALLEPREAAITRKLERMIKDRKQSSGDPVQLRINTSGPGGSAGLTGLAGGPQVPLSPLRIGPTATPQSPVPMEPTVPVPGTRDWPLARPKAEKNGVYFEASAADHAGRPISSVHSSNTHHGDSTQEDQEVLEIVQQGELYRIDTQPANTQSGQHRQPQADASRHCDSVLQELSASECVLEGDECQQEVSGSPCTSGGLHMPNSQSMYHFTQRVNRMRYYSQCTPTSSSHNLAPGKGTVSTGSSPGETGFFLTNNRVRRAFSCPEMEKSQPMHSGDVTFERALEEKEEDVEELGNEVMVNGKGGGGVADAVGHAALVEMISEGTQTMDCAPYEHLFLSVFPQLDQCSPAQSPAPTMTNNAVNTDWCLFPPRATKFSPQAVLDRYLETVTRESPNRARSASDEELRLLREQLALLHIELQFERQRREVHSERNRRLLGKSRNNRAIEEHRNALKEQLSLVEKDIENLKSELARVRHEARKRENELQESLKHWQLKCNRLQKECSGSNAKCHKTSQELILLKDKNTSISKDMQRMQSALVNARKEVRHASASAATSQQLRAEVKTLQRKLLLMGEAQVLCRARIQQLATVSNKSEEMALYKEACRQQIAALSLLDDTRGSALEATKARISELENGIQRRESALTEQKKMLKVVKEEFDVKLEAMESRYKSQRAINIRQEQYILELCERAEVAESKYRSLKKKFYGANRPNADAESGANADADADAGAGANAMGGGDPSSPPRCRADPRLMNAIARSNARGAGRQPEPQQLVDFQALIKQSELPDASEDKSVRHSQDGR